MLGGGDGLAVREILKYPGVESVTLVDLDAGITRLFRTQDVLLGLNKASLNSPKVRIINADAFVWMKDNRAPVRFHCCRFSRSVQFFTGETVYQYLLPAARTFARGKRRNRGPDHFSLYGSQVLLVRGQDAAVRRAQYHALSCQRAVVRGMGLYSRNRKDFLQCPDDSPRASGSLRRSRRPQ